MDKAKLQPALLGGLFIGVMSALPVVSAGNCCCCLWVLAGGALAVYLSQQNQGHALTSGEGALLGLMAGVIGGIVGGVLSLIVSMAFGPIMQEWINRAMEANQDMPPELRDAFSKFGMGGFALIGALINLVVYSVFGLLGGLIGVAIFKKNVPPAPPTVTTIPHDPGTAL
jgi:hypothetical protein